jgi:molybdopterin molybdotransferase
MGCCDVSGLLPIENAIKMMLEAVNPIQIHQSVPLDNALDRVLATDIHSPMNIPPFDNAAMDGYAVRRQDLEESLILPVAGKALAGRPFTQSWPKGSCVRIMTGAKIPEGCDMVIVQEQTEMVDDHVQFHLSCAPSECKRFSNIRPVGNDLKMGDIILEKGSRLTARDLPMIASLGIAKVNVYRRPKIAIFSTGDELKPLETPLNEGDIYDSNRYGVNALLEKLGCDTIDLGIIPDDPAQLERAFTQAQTLADVIITSGGVSVGEADYTKDILAHLGEINFWKLAIKPGKPFAFGQLGSTLFCGLPGNPMSAMITMYVLVQPLLAKLSGNDKWQKPELIQATSLCDFKPSLERTDYQRGVYFIKNGRFHVDSAGNQSSGAFRAMAAANCFIVLEPKQGQIKAGEHVNIQLFNSSLN